MYPALHNDAVSGGADRTDEFDFLRVPRRRSVAPEGRGCEFESRRVHQYLLGSRPLETGPGHTDVAVGLDRWRLSV